MIVNFREWLMNEFDHDTWASVPQDNNPKITMIDPKELYKNQSSSNKRIMQAQAKEDAKYLNNLKNSVSNGMKQPIQVDSNMNIQDGLHRLAVALSLDLPQVPIIVIEK